MTPAMEEIAQLRKRNLELASQEKISKSNDSKRLTRSEAAKLRRNFDKYNLQISNYYKSFLFAMYFYLIR